MRRELTTLSELARLGFARLGSVRERLEELEGLVGAGDDILDLLGGTADPDQALDALLRLARQHPDAVRATLGSAGATRRLLLVLGASTGLADFLHRRPEALEVLALPMTDLPEPEELRADLLDAVGAGQDGVAALSGDEGRIALRTRYRRQLLRLAAWDLGQPRPLDAVQPVTAVLADLAAAALDASLAVARADAARPGPGRSKPEDIAGTRLAIIRMGKAGARGPNHGRGGDGIFRGG